MKHRILASASLLIAWGSAIGSPTAPLADLPSPLDLKGAIGYALDHNFAILQARETIRLQEGVIVQVRSQQIPNISAQGQYQRNAAAISQIYPPSSSLWAVELKATQTLFAGGGVMSSIKGAKLTRDAAAYDLQTAIDTALLDVRTKFYNVLLARDKIRVEEENVRLYEHQLEDTKNQFESRDGVQLRGPARKGVPRERPAEPDHGPQRLPNRGRAAAPVARRAGIRCVSGGRRQPELRA